MKNKATLKFKNFTARSRFFWVRTKLARAGEILCCACPAEAVCLERSNAVAKPSGVGKNLKSQNFKNRNAASTNCEAGRYIDFSADCYTDRDINFNAYRDINSSADRGMCHGINSNTDRDINSGRDRAVNFKISNANLKADLARPKASFR
ncbi:hypothetical protein [Campylobacter gracilis]|nr:hypothetical protein [Campylobacter gracilis]UEB44756.1 hypothetical protein LK410_06965 [Campylobacter gracilis]SUW78597.1 Uncharacterised protein [Campylobacter gracilis]